MNEMHHVDFEMKSRDGASAFRQEFDTKGALECVR